MPTTSKSRKIPGGLRKGDRSVIYESPISEEEWAKVAEAVSEGWDGYQVTDSEGHPWPPPKGSGLQDDGGNFATSKEWLDVGSTSASAHYEDKSIGRRFKYDGPICAPFPIKAGHGPLFPKSTPSSQIELDEAGARAIAYCKPTSPVNDVSTFLAEGLSEGFARLPSIRTWESRADVLRGLGSEYLNYQFGWHPLIDEISSFASSVGSAAQTMRQYERDAGNVVRRRFAFPTDTKEESFDLGESNPQYGALSSGIFTPGTTYHLYVTNTWKRKSWFSGAFTYYLPQDESLFGKLFDKGSAADKFLGSSLTPETLWELTPWSWAVDWFSDAQEVVSNLSDFQSGSLVMRYGYLMEETSATTSYSIRPAAFEGPKARKAAANLRVSDSTLRSVTKVRRQANPFGFGLDWEGLSPTQIAIAAALGLTRFV